MEEKEVIIEGPLKLGDVTLITVAEMLLSCKSSSSGAVFSATKKPLCIVMIFGSEKRAFDMDGQDIPIDRVIAFAPTLETILNGL